MVELRRNIFYNIDWIVVLIYISLVFMGWINIYAAVYNDEHQSIFDISQNYGKQLIWIFSAIVMALTILLIDAKFFTTFAYPIYGLVLFILIIVLFFGNEVSGSKSWFVIGKFALQPSEFAKFATSLALAKFLNSLNTKKENFKNKVIPIALVSLPMVLIFLQNDTGSALVYFCFGLMLYREGLLSGNILILCFLTAVLFVCALLVSFISIVVILLLLILIVIYFNRKNKKSIILFIGIFIAASMFVYSVHYVFDNVLESHQKSRINVLLGKETDMKGAGYNINQSKIAIGSGGFLGKGFLEGTQTKFDFVPEQSTDFIFCTVGEEWGFVGSFIVIVLFIGLFVRLIFLAERQRSTLSRIYGYCVASILFFHFTINIGMAVGLLPVIGIPLPFFSYGGSSLWGFTILLFIFIKQDAYRLQLL